MAVRLVGVGKRPALAGLDLHVARGELVALVGPSSSGKSTALRIIAGLERPDAGCVVVPRDVALVAQRDALYAHLSVFENLAFALRVRRAADVEIEARVHEAAALLGIGALLARKPGRLSTGERQRVAIARALARRPSVLLLDEPLGCLDAALRLETRAAIERAHREAGCATIYATHDAAEAAFADRVVRLTAGCEPSRGRACS